MTVKERLEALRILMKEKGVDAYLVPTTFRRCLFSFVRFLTGTGTAFRPSVRTV